MKKRLLQALLLVIIFGLMWLSSLGEALAAEGSFASNYDHIYTFNVQYGYYQLSHKLYTSMPPSLYDYYHTKSHIMRSDGDYSKFVTPGAFKSIAENIQNATRSMSHNDEQFANAVLMLIRQVSYVKSDVKYPVEAMVENSGDCDVLSLLAASIMKAGGLDVVLFLYNGMSPSHMNVGVYLPYAPVYRTWWMTSASYEYNNKTYWMAECTSRGEWKVGDQPELLASTKPHIISLENCEKTSPAHVSSNMDSSLTPSSISITLAEENSSAIEKERALTISGSISPAYTGKSVVMYVNQAGYSYNTFSTVTDQLGNYSFTWNFNSTGTYYFRTSWSDFSNYAGSDSEKLTVYVGSYTQFSEDGTPPYYYGAGFNDAFARANSVIGYRLLVNQAGKEFLKSNLTGTGVLLSGEIIMLKNNQTTVPKGEQTMTIPASRRVIGIPGSRRTLTILRSEQTITMPSEQTPNNQLGFILRYNGENNYNATVRVLSDYDISKITKQPDGNNTTFINASRSTRENTWYKIAARISEGAVTAELYAENGTLLEKTARDNAVNASESRILITYDADTVIAFKNLKVETLDQPSQPDDGSQIPANELELSAPYIGLAILLAVAIAAIAYVKERKRLTNEQTPKVANRLIPGAQADGRFLMYFITMPGWLSAVFSVFSGFLM
jgi:hypothetical protein